MRKANYRPSDLLRGEAIPDDILAALPKTDLHCHLDGSLRLDTFVELARESEMDVPDSPEGVVEKFFPRDRVRSQHEFLKYFDHTLAVLQDERNLRRVAREVALDAAAQGCWYQEVRFCPLLHQQKGLNFDAILSAVARGLADAEKESGIHTGIIVTGLRTIAPETSLKLARLAVDWRQRGVVAFDLAGAEEDYPAKAHLEAFYYLQDNNMNSTVHAGEGFGPASIHQALHYCGANRIGHGTRLHEDRALMEYVADHRVPLEICLSSNLQTCVVDDLGDHPLRHYLDLGLRVTLNTDNTLFARTDQTRELRLAVDTFDLTLLEAESLLLHGFKSAFLPAAQKGKQVSEVLATFASLRDKFDLDVVADPSAATGSPDAGGES